MKLYKEGDKSKAICARCEGVRTTTFRGKDVPLSSGHGVVKEVLAGVCDECGDVVTIPQQSVPRIQETLQTKRHSLEARVPLHLRDALALACHRLGYGPEASQPLLRFYVQQAASMKKVREQLSVLATSEEATGRAGTRVSIKLSADMNALVEGLRGKGITRTVLVKGIIVKIKKDVLDSKPKSTNRLKELQRFMRAATT